MITEKMIEAACKAIIEKRGYVWPDGFSDEEKTIGRENMRAALEAALSTDAEPVGKVKVHYAYCCPGSTKYCDCVNKNHGTAWIGANEVGNDYIPVAPPAPSVAVKALEWKRIITSWGYLLVASDPFSREAYGIRVEDSTTEEDIANAKAEKQADYEARIRSALSAQVQDVAEDSAKKEFAASARAMKQLADHGPDDDLRDAMREMSHRMFRVLAGLSPSALPAAPAAKRDDKVFCAMLTTGVCDKHTIPEGWQLVPKELTPELRKQLQMHTEMGAYVCENLCGAYGLMDEYHAAMLSAAPAVKLEVKPSWHDPRIFDDAEGRN